MSALADPRFLASAAPLRDRVAVVTGASSGIGLAAARVFAQAGARVHGVARRREAMEEGVGRQLVESGAFRAHALDVGDAAGAARLVKEVSAEGPIDVLLLAAGLNIRDRALEELTPDSWDRLIRTNLNGAFYLTRAALEPLRAARGCVIMIGSVSGSWPDQSGAAYQASKAGMLAFARAAGFEEHQNGVRFTTVAPGIVDTPILDSRPSPPPPEVRSASLQPEDVAAACLFVATLPERAYVPELTILPAALQALGKTHTATRSLPVGGRS